MYTPVSILLQGGVYSTLQGGMYSPFMTGIGNKMGPGTNAAASQLQNGLPAATAADGTGSTPEAAYRQYASGWLAIHDYTWKSNAAAGSFSWFMFGADGRMLTGWLTDTNGKKYYLNNTPGTGLGAMLTGWHEIEGKRYYFSEVTDNTHLKGELIEFH